MGKISINPRYVIKISGPDPLPLEELRGDFQCFGKIGASEGARTMKIGGCVRDLHRLT